MYPCVFIRNQRVHSHTTLPSWLILSVGANFGHRRRRDLLAQHAGAAGRGSQRVMALWWRSVEKLPNMIWTEGVAHRRHHLDKLYTISVTYYTLTY